MICTFNFTYGWMKNAKPETYAAIREILPQISEDQKKFEEFSSYESDIRPLLRLSVPIEIKQELRNHFMSSLTERLDRMEELLLRKNRLTSSENTMNERCNVHVAGLGTLLIDKVEIQQDLCTEELQKHLDDGWRVLAVCVQPDQRRPDYVLGKARYGKPLIIKDTEETIF